MNFVLYTIIVVLGWYIMLSCYVVGAGSQAQIDRHQVIPAEFIAWCYDSSWYICNVLDNWELFILNLNENQINQYTSSINTKFLWVTYTRPLLQYKDYFQGTGISIIKISHLCDADDLMLILWWSYAGKTLGILILTPCLYFQTRLKGPHVDLILSVISTYIYIYMGQVMEVGRLSSYLVLLSIDSKTW